jgi:ribosomal protein S27E
MYLRDTTNQERQTKMPQFRIVQNNLAFLMEDQGPFAIQFECEQCGETVQVPVNKLIKSGVGANVRCHSCGNITYVPPNAGKATYASSSPDAQWVVEITSPQCPFPLYLDKPCSSLATMQKISAQTWCQRASLAAHFTQEDAERLATEGNASGAKDTTFKAIISK